PTRARRRGLLEHPMLAPLRGESDSASAAFALFPARRHRCVRRPQSREFFMTAAPAQTLSFADLGVPARIVDTLIAVDRPTPFPSARAGRDVLGRGKTGSGKTLAFAIPLAARLSDEKRIPRRPTGLVLAPTRELATQIAKVVAPLAEAEGLTVTTVFGGVSQRPQEQAFARGVDI